MRSPPLQRVLPHQPRKDLRDPSLGRPRSAATGEANAASDYPSPCLFHGTSNTSYSTCQSLAILNTSNTTLVGGVGEARPFIHGYAHQTGGQSEDVSEIFAAGYAWASGGIVSTPADQNRFIRGYVGGTLFGGKARTGQFQFVSGNSEPPGPGRNAAGLGLFRYRTRCGTMFGHTGNTPGYTQFFAVSRNGQRSPVLRSVRFAGRTPPTSPRTSAGCGWRRSSFGRTSRCFLGSTKCEPGEPPPARRRRQEVVVAPSAAAHKGAVCSHVAANGDTRFGLGFGPRARVVLRPIPLGHPNLVQSSRGKDGDDDERPG